VSYRFRGLGRRFSRFEVVIRREVQALLIVEDTLGLRSQPRWGFEVAVCTHRERAFEGLRLFAPP
jgi:hypothetical protein